MKNTDKQELKRLLIVTLFSLIVMGIVNILVMIARILTESFICQLIIFSFIMIMVDWETDKENDIEIDRRNK